MLGGVISEFLVFGYGRSFGVFYGKFLEQFQKSAAESAWIGALYQFSSQILGTLQHLLLIARISHESCVTEVGIKQPSTHFH